MARRSPRNHPAGLIESAPLAVDPTGMFEAFVRRIERIGNLAANNNGNVNNQGNGMSARQMGDKRLERFRALRPEQFAGTAEPWKAEQWLRQMDHIFETMDCNDQEIKRLATFQLTYAAADWWEAVKATIGEEAVRVMTWTTFRRKFLEKYFPATERHKREREFMDLVQGNKSVQEYTTQFERLSQFAPHMVDTNEKKI